MVTGLHLPQDTRVIELASAAPVPTKAGRKGTVLTLPATAEPAARVLRVTPVPPS
ncbi:hypothetical protein AB0A71_30835 [Kitasatospora aureofaciens]|uniref:hypothetical protein n=1 Tax=Kitasatospora aureofaciens TaxID=1894 RepID=UPI0033DEDC15